jgi:hypothetical protein
MIVFYSAAGLSCPMGGWGTGPSQWRRAETTVNLPLAVHCTPEVPFSAIDFLHRKILMTFSKGPIFSD